MLVTSFFVIINNIFTKERRYRILDINSKISEMLSEIDDETDLENEIQEKALDLAKKLFNYSTQRTWIKGKEYTASYKRINDNMQIVLIDHMRLSIAGTHYRPAVCELLFDEKFSELENLEKLIQTVLYYKHDMIRAEDVVGEEDSVWQVQKTQK